MKFCTNCGAQIEDTAAFCTVCGTPQEADVNATATAEASNQQPSQEAYTHQQSEQPAYEYKPPVQEQPSYQQQSQQQAYTNYQYTPGYTQPIIPPEYKPLSAWAYFGYSLLFAIPLVGLICMIVFACGAGQNINLRNYARSYFCWLVIAAIICLVILILVLAGCLSVANFRIPYFC